MTLIDDRGRLFGKVNLIDAVVGVFVLVLIPLAYGAMVLFRVPIPKITSITPAQVVEHSTTPLQLAGQDLRPYLRVRVGPLYSPGFLLQSPLAGEIKLPDLPPGTYDISLYDDAQELVRKPNALTIVPVPPVVVPPPPAPPPPVFPRITVDVVGAFVGLDGQHARRIGTDSRFMQEQDGKRQTVAQVLAVRPAEPGTQRVKVGDTAFVTAPKPGEFRVPAILRLDCAVQNTDCKLGDIVIARTATIKLPLLSPAKKGADHPEAELVSFVIDDVGLADAPVPVTFAAPPAALPRIDVDAVGAFVGLDNQHARQIAQDSKFVQEQDGKRQTIAAVLAVRSPEPGTQRVKIGDGSFVSAPAPGEVRVPAIIRLNCAVQNTDCKVGDTVVARNAMIRLPWSLAGPSSTPRNRMDQPELSSVNFLIDEVDVAQARVTFASSATIKVRFFAGAEVLNVMKVGDIDVVGSSVLSDRAVLTDIGSERQAVSAVTNTETVLRRSLQIQQPMVAFTATVRVPVVFTPSGWSYKELPVKVGAPFTFETVSGAMVGWILDMAIANNK